MMSFFKPDRYFTRITDIDIERDIRALGYRCLFLDIDNTLLTRDTHEVPEDVAAWLERAREVGLTICLLSNNWHHGVYELAERLGLPLVAKAVKPLPHAYLRARRKTGVSRRETLAIGDQLMTDVLGAHAMGHRAYLLQPLVEKDLWHTLLLRNVERLFIGGLEPEGTGVQDGG